jgi:hypothetical protein
MQGSPTHGHFELTPSGTQIKNYFRTACTKLTESFCSFKKFRCEFWLAKYWIKLQFEFIITPRSRVLEENLTVVYLVKKIHYPLRIPNVHYRVHKSPPLDSILNHMNGKYMVSD